MNNKGKYPKILIDTTKQSAIPNGKYSLTVEEYYDITHHTHNLSDIVLENGTDGESPITIEEKINQLDTKISDIQTLIDNGIQFNDEGYFIDEEDEP